MTPSRSLALLLIASCFLSACSPSPTPDPTPVTVDSFASCISVTGKLVPEVWASVGVASPGRVVAIHVGVGDQVAEGDLLVQLDDQEAQAAVVQAETAVLQAEAELNRLKAGPSAREIDVAVAQVETARTVLTQTLEQRAQLWDGQFDAQLATIDAQIAAAQAEQLVARQQHDETMRCHEVTHADGSKEKICPALGTLEEQARFALNAAAAQVVALEAQKVAAQAEHRARLVAAESNIEAAEKQLAVAEAQLAQLREGPRGEEIALAETAVAQAEAALAAAQVRAASTVIRAPFDATVAAVDVRVGEFATPGVPLITVGDLSTLRVETTDLDEIDVGRLVEGQEAVVTFDALPDRTFVGTVVHIAPMATMAGGGVNYRVILTLDDLDPTLRWGMTAFVDLETE